MKNFTNVYIDMEYRKNDVTGTFKLICVSLEVDELVTSFDLRRDEKDFKDFHILAKTKINRNKQNYS